MKILLLIGRTDRNSELESTVEGFAAAILKQITKKVGVEFIIPQERDRQQLGPVIAATGCKVGNIHMLASITQEDGQTAIPAGEQLDFPWLTSYLQEHDGRILHVGSENKETLKLIADIGIGMTDSIHKRIFFLALGQLPHQALNSNVAIKLSVEEQLSREDREEINRTNLEHWEKTWEIELRINSLKETLKAEQNLLDFEMTKVDENMKKLRDGFEERPIRAFRYKVIGPNGFKWIYKEAGTNRNVKEAELTDSDHQMELFPESVEQLVKWPDHYTPGDEGEILAAE